MIDNLLENGFYLEYMHWRCFDDGGLGHDAWMEKTRQRLKATNEKDARKEAKAILTRKDQCGGSFCKKNESGGNRQFIKFEKITTKIERKVVTFGKPK